MVGILTNLAAGYWVPATGDVYQRITCQNSESLNIIVASLRECGKPRWPLGNVGCGLMFLSWPANLWVRRGCSRLTAGGNLLFLWRKFEPRAEQHRGQNAGEFS